MSGHFPILCISIILTLLSLAAADGSNNCVYTIYVKTGSIIKAGTDAKISLTLGDGLGRSVWVPDLESWGLMGPAHEYYERGNLDVFSGRGACIGIPICRLNLTSDGSGHNHGWYCDYVEVTSSGPHMACSQTIFEVDQWLADDAPPFELTAVIDGCRMKSDGDAEAAQKPRDCARREGPLRVERPKSISYA